MLQISSHDLSWKNHILILLLNHPLKSFSHSVNASVLAQLLFTAVFLPLFYVCLNVRAGRGRGVIRALLLYKKEFKTFIKDIIYTFYPVYLSSFFFCFNAESLFSSLIAFVTVFPNFNCMYPPLSRRCSSHFAVCLCLIFVHQEWVSIPNSLNLLKWWAGLASSIYFYYWVTKYSLLH